MGPVAFRGHSDGMGIARTFAFCLAAVAPALSPAGTLYKSVDANGIVSFSDLPPAGNARILEQRELPTVQSGSGFAPNTASYASASPTSSSNGEPIIGTPPEQWLGSDPMVAQANQRLDAAERALAEARRARGSPLDGMRMRNASLAREEEARIEQENANVKAARRALADLLRERQLPLKQAQAQAAGIGGMPIVVASR